MDKLAELEDAARDVLDISPGFAVIQENAARASAELAALLGQEGLAGPERVVPLPAYPSASARLALFAGELLLTREVACLADAISGSTRAASRWAEMSVADIGGHRRSGAPGGRSSVTIGYAAVT